jgi:hypothetical protein
VEVLAGGVVVVTVVPAAGGVVVVAGGVVVTVVPVAAGGVVVVTVVPLAGGVVVVAGGVVVTVPLAGGVTAVVLAGTEERPELGRFVSGCPGVTCTKSSVVFAELSLCLAALTMLFVSEAPVLTMTIFFGREGREVIYCSA